MFFDNNMYIWNTSEGNSNEMGELSLGNQGSECLPKSGQYRPFSARKKVSHRNECINFLHKCTFYIECILYCLHIVKNR